MAMRKQHALVAGFIAVALSGMSGAIAQTARPGSGAANAQAMQQVQQLASERTALQAENARIKADLEAARKERDSLKPALKRAQDALIGRDRSADAEVARVQGDKARVDGELAREKARVEELVQRLRETAVSVREVEVDRGAKTQLLAQREQELKVARERNEKLHVLATEIISKLEDQGFWSAVSRREPFTQLKRVELENLADNYRAAADDQRLPDSSGSSR
jgi:chromosome segregation ATPase